MHRDTIPRLTISFFMVLPSSLRSRPSHSATQASSLASSSDVCPWSNLVKSSTSLKKHNSKLNKYHKVQNVAKILLKLSPAEGQRPINQIFLTFLKKEIKLQLWDFLWRFYSGHICWQKTAKNRSALSQLFLGETLSTKIKVFFNLPEVVYDELHVVLVCVGEEGEDAHEPVVEVGAGAHVHGVVQQARDLLHRRAGEPLRE